MTDLQETINNYWENAVSDFDPYMKEDLEENRKRLWLNKIVSYIDTKNPMQVLDVGTGPGFFPIILAEAGHIVSAIDCVEKMLEKARENARIAGITANFFNMDSHCPDFPDNKFDLIISRNVTWTLYDPVKAYKEWIRILKPGGKILIFDANYGHSSFDTNIAEQQKINEKEYHEKYEKPSSARVEYFERMFLSDKQRPEWDIDTFRNLGMKVTAETNVNELRNERGRIYYKNIIPLFLVIAEKLVSDRAINTL